MENQNNQEKNEDELNLKPVFETHALKIIIIGVILMIILCSAISGMIGYGFGINKSYKEQCGVYTDTQVISSTEADCSLNNTAINGYINISS